VAFGKVLAHAARDGGDKMAAVKWESRKRIGGVL